MINRSETHETLILALEPWVLCLKNTSTYSYLVEAWCDYTDDMCQETRLKLYHASENFRHLANHCEYCKAALHQWKQNQIELENKEKNRLNQKESMEYQNNRSQR